MTNHLLEIKQYGQSIWMDNLTRDLIQSGELNQMVEEQGICGIASNPAIFGSKALAEKNANVQRLFWASTSTKNPAYSDVMYVDELVGREMVNTLPPQTIEACANRGDVADRVESNLDEAYQTIESLQDPDVKIDLDRVMADLLTEGIDKFVQPFQALMDSLEEKVKKLQPVS